MNVFDYVLIALLAVSCIAGIMRGLLREVIGLVTCVAGVLLAWTYGADLEPFLGGTLASAALRPWAARILVFVGALLIGALIGAVVTHFVRLSIFSGTDRFLGGMFGVLRGAALIGAFVILCHGLHLQGEPWWRESMLMPYAESTANVLRGMVGERKIHAQRAVTSG
jgi:membrane protein required for colicin V production